MAKNEKMSARALATAALARYRRGARPDEALDSLFAQNPLERRDAALAARIVLGVVQNQYLLDFYISCYSKTRPEKLEPRVLDILRAGAYQLIFLDRIPSSAAVNESVALAKRVNPRVSGLVNAVLRRISEAAPDKLPEIPGAGSAGWLSTLHSHPLWLAEEYIARLGFDDAQALLRANNAQAPVTAQVNTARTTAHALIESLRARGIEAAPGLMPDCVDFTPSGAVTELPEFQNGWFYVQDAAARLAVLAAGIEPGGRVLDCCAAPGGKSFAAALAMGNRGYVLSCDITEKKTARIVDGAARLGLGIIETRVMDAREPDAELFEAFDTVLADVPCSGFGVIRKKPEIRYKSEAEISGLPAIQSAILRGAARCVRPGGTLLYSTCTTREEENGAVIDAFLAENSGFSKEEIDIPIPGEHKMVDITLFPHKHGTDGFYICKLRKSAT